MFFWGSAIDEEVIDIHDDKIVNVFRENGVHGGLERGGGVAQAEGHYCPIVMSVLCSGSGFRDIFFGYSDKMKSRLEIDLSENPSIFQSI